MRDQGSCKQRTPAVKHVRKGAMPQLPRLVARLMRKMLLSQLLLCAGVLPLASGVLCSCVPEAEAASGIFRLGVPGAGTASGVLHLGVPGAGTASGVLHVGVPGAVTASCVLCVGVPGVLCVGVPAAESNNPLGRLLAESSLEARRRPFSLPGDRAGLRPRCRLAGVLRAPEELEPCGSGKAKDGDVDEIAEAEDAVGDVSRFEAVGTVRNLPARPVAEDGDGVAGTEALEATFSSGTGPNRLGSTSTLRTRSLARSQRRSSSAIRLVSPSTSFAASMRKPGITTSWNMPRE